MPKFQIDIDIEETRSTTIIVEVRRTTSLPPRRRRFPVRSWPGRKLLPYTDQADPEIDTATGSVSSDLKV